MDKSPDAFRTISEAAEELDLPQHVLRFWETRFSTIRPLKRGGGRRYYRPEDVLLLKGIRHLLYDQGFTIKGVQRILKDQGVRNVIAIGDGRPLEGVPLPAMDGEDADVDAPVEIEAEVELDADAAAERVIEGRPAPPRAYQPASLDDEDREKLAEVLRELLDCKRILERARET
ncbi:MAG TPA: MerR family transcriptional regulator [Devosiaceae bacterium]|nr:MerR family transcriptional regulator [Devosiaceae bacterium]